MKPNNLKHFINVVHFCLIIWPVKPFYRKKLLNSFNSQKGAISISARKAKEVVKATVLGIKYPQVKNFK